MPSASTSYVVGYSPAYPLDAAIIANPAPGRSAPWAGAKYGVAAFHGHGGAAANAWTFGYQSFSPQSHWRVLAESGYYGMGPDLELPNWGDPQSVRTMDDVYTYMTATMGCDARIFLFGYSMGGLSSLAWALRNPSKVAGIVLFAPATDLDYFHSTAGYAPSYGLAGDTNWSAEIDVGFTQGTTVQTTTTMPASGAAGITLTVTDAKQLAAGTPVASGATLPGGTFTYTGKTDTTLTGCTSTGAAFAVTTGQALTSTYAQQSPGYSPLGQAAALATAANANGFRVKIYHASDDTVVPPAMTVAFRNAWNATGFGSLLTVDQSMTGNHTGFFLNIPLDSPVKDFAKSFYGHPLPSWESDMAARESWVPAGIRRWNGDT
jgi:pimeloyl-ACP methyl ester carboxylesterase